MDPHTGEFLGVFLERIDDHDGLTVGVRHHDVGAGLDVLQYRFGLDEFVFNCVQRHGVPPSGRGCVVGGAWHPLLSQGMPENCGIFAVVSRRGR